MSKKEMEKLQEELQSKSHIELMPNEVIFMNDETMIRNFEVDFAEEEELVYAGGIKGIKALRLQRELLRQTIEKQP
jgi:hypothetical protein